MEVMDADTIIGYCGKGKGHTNREGSYNPLELSPITLERLYHSIDNPQKNTIKTNAWWFIPSTYPSRIKKDQDENNGMYTCLYADLDKSPPGVEDIGLMIQKFIFDSNVEIYNTHSASEDNKKSRIIIPLLVELTIPEWFAGQTILNNFLESEGLTVDKSNLKPVQLEFLPNNNGTYYNTFSIRDGKFFNILKAYRKEVEKLSVGYDKNGSKEDKEIRSGRGGGSESKSEAIDIDTMIDILVTGKDPYHDMQLKYSTGQIKDGVAPKIVKASMKGFMMAWQHKAESIDGGIKRWQERYDDIDRTVDGVKKKGSDHKIDWKDLDIDDVTNGMIKTELPFPTPPGLLGEFYTDLYKMQIYQHMEFCHVTAIGLIAGVCGRRFNIDGLGLNVYLMILADTARGKDFIGKTVRRVLSSANDMGLGCTFIGGQRFTAGKGLAQELFDHRSQVCVFTEAGLLFQSKSGDQANLTKALLSLYSMSAEHDYTGKEIFSDKENGIKSMRSPALTLISESTPTTILDQLHGGNNLENGLLPRHSLYRIAGEIPDPNMEPKTFIDSKFMDRISDLIKECNPFQNDNIVFKVKQFEWFDLENDMKSFWLKCESIRRKEKNSTKGIMASRMLVKAKKYACLASIFNAKMNIADNDSEFPLVVGHREWAWAKNIVLYELDNTLKFFGGSNFINPLEDLIISVVGVVMFKMKQNKYNGTQIKLTAEERENDIIPFKKIAQVLKQNNELKFNGVSDPITGLEMVLDHMVKMSYIEYIPAPVGGDTRGRATRINRSYNPNDCFKMTDNLINLMITGDKKG